MTACVVGVLAEALAQHREGSAWVVSSGANQLTVMEYCCGRGWRVRGAWADGSPHLEHVASVVAALPNIAIVPKSDIVRVYRAASTLGQQYMLPTYFGADLEEAERWFALQQEALDGLPGVDTVRLEYEDMWVTKWEPLAAARAAGGEQ